MAEFSWSDSVRAVFSPCLSCLQSRGDPLPEDDVDSHNQNRGPDFVPRARSDELEGLLADADDAETLSLHSNVGRPDVRRKKRSKRSPKNIQLFGFNLFGRPPIQLPEDDDEDNVDGSHDHSRRRPRTVSNSTVDSDAAPLDPATIAQLSAARQVEGAAQREAERAAKEERRRRKREKKRALQQAALAAALERGDGDEFEGFPGSGNVYSPTYGPDTHSSDGRSSATREEFGPFEQAQTSSRFVEDFPEEEAADFGGEFYSKPNRAKSASGSGGSDSLSRTSGRVSNADPGHYNHHYLSQQETALSRQDDTPRRKKAKRSISSRQSSSTTSQSNSIASPPPHYTTFPSIAEQESYSARLPHFSQPDSTANFPSVGFGGGLRRKNSEAGVFLARRGDE